MIDDIKRIDSMINALRNMKQDIKRQQKLSEINSLDLSPKQAQKRNADADWIAMEQIKRVGMSCTLCLLSLGSLSAGKVMLHLN